jgi:hypothetical protein
MVADASDDGDATTGGQGGVAGGTTDASTE